MTKYKKTDIKHKFDGVSRLGYSIQGKRGGTPQIKDDLGRVSVFVDSSMGCQLSSGNSITVNAFEGYGDTYKRRDKCEITIRNCGQEVFNGSFIELIERICPVKETIIGNEPVSCNVLK